MGNGRLKPGWTRVAFGDVVRQVRDHVDPATTDLRRYVAGEHMDTDNLRIRRWGIVGDGYLGPAFHMRFRPGHVLYGSRRTYLRKVAVADFEGVTANTTFVIDTRDPNVLLPELLPFIMQTESFHDHSIRKSKGSVNPYVNFSDVAAYEFAMPPLNEQRRLANALSAIEVSRRRHMDLLDLHETTSSSFLVERLRSFSNILSLEELTNTIEYGTSLRTHSDKTGVPVLRIPNILRGTLDFGELKYARLSPIELARFRLAEGDILMVRTNGNPAYVGRCVVVPELPETTAFASYLLRIVPKVTRVLPRFVAAVLNAPSTRRQLRALARSSAGNYNISASGLRSVSLPCPSLQDQDLLLAELETLSRTKDAILLRLATLKKLRLL